MNQDIVLSRGIAAFLQSGVSVRLAASTGSAWPVTGRALAVAVADDLRTVSLVLAERPSGPILQAVRETGRIAAAVTRPVTHRSIQLKGTDARIEAPLPDDGELIRRQGAPFVLDLRELGYPEPLLTAIRTYRPGPLVRVAFTVAGLFEQTPGASAGEPLVP